MKSFNIVLIVVLTASSILLPQTSNIKKYHPLSGTVVLNIEGGATYTLSDFKSSDFNYFGRLSGTYYFPTTQIGVWGIRALAGGGYLSGSGGATASRPELMKFRTPVFFLGGGAEYILHASKTVLPYVYGGASYLYYDPQDTDGNRLERNSIKKYSRHEWMLIGELGIRFLASKTVSVNFGANVNYVPSDNLDDVVAGSDNDIFFTGFAGVSIYFGGTRDSDKDGIDDGDDLCPDTPRGVVVDQFGCPVDNDNDGIADYLDKCPDTPANILVDRFGCPVDSDGDGVPDYLDLCKDTPVGVPVDQRGCPFDDDNDGVPNYRDQCSNTPVGTEVNRWGCPLETQKKKLPEVTSLILSGGVNFEVGKSTLLPAAKNEIDKMIKVMREHPDTKWKIEGHTDNTGSYDLNKKLSYERASSVAQYIIFHGIDRSRLDVSGKGPDYPVADNSTESGRALNRRVTIELITGVEENQDKSFDTRYDFSDERHIGNMIFTDGKLYCFQVSSFRTRSRAETEAARLRSLGEKAFVIEAHLPQLDGIWYRVRIGYFKTLAETRQVKKRVIR